MKKPTSAITFNELLVRQMTPEEKKRYDYPDHVFIPVIELGDVCIIPVKDATAKSTGTFALLHEDGAVDIINRGGPDDS